MILSDIFSASSQLLVGSIVLITLYSLKPLISSKRKSKVEKKIVWITGASSGIGEALAIEYSKENAKLILSSRRVEELKRVKNACGFSDSDERALILPLDLGGDYQSMQEKVKIALKHFGQVDILINNGGISQRSLIAETDVSVYKKLIDIDYLGTVAITKALLPHFVQRKEGHIVVISSVMGKFSSPLRSGYSAAKHALHGFFDALRMEHHNDNIKVTIICPGYVQTNVSLNALTKDGSKQMIMDKKTAQGMSVDKCAKEIISAVKSEKMEVIIGGVETFAVYINRFFPSVIHSIGRKIAVT